MIQLFNFSMKNLVYFNSCSDITIFVVFLWYVFLIAVIYISASGHEKLKLNKL